MPKFYRIENEIGEGPYHGENVPEREEWQEFSHNESPNTPTLSRDIYLSGNHPGDLYCLNQAYIFGFESMEQLLKWFMPKEIQMLEMLGYNIVEVEGYDACYFHSQVIFFRAIEENKQAA